MEGKGKITFEEIFKQNKSRIHYYIHKMNVRDSHHEFYQEGIVVAMWNVYEIYQPDKGVMSTYFNYMIRNRMIDLMRKSKREKEKEVLCVQEHRTVLEDGHSYSSGQVSYPLLKGSEGIFENPDFWEEISVELSMNQRRWVQRHIVEGLKLKEIAEQESVSVYTVNSWSRETIRKLRDKVEEGKLRL